MNVTIYHNPRCSKSRQTLELLKARGLSPTIIEYLESPPDTGTLTAILKKLGLEPRHLMRTNEARYTELGLSSTDLSDDDLTAAMVDNPILIERPIVVVGEKAVIGRPPENIAQLFAE